MRLSWEGEAEDAAAAARAGSEVETLRAQAEGAPLVVGNEFAEVRVTKVQTRNGVRLLVESPKSGQWITLDPLELESLTWQEPEFFSRLLATPFGPEPAADPGAGDS